MIDDDGPVVGARVRLSPDPLTLYDHLRIQRTRQINWVISL